MRRTLAIATLLCCSPLAANANTEVNIGYLEFVPPKPPVLSNILPAPEDSGLRGSELAIKDSNTTGRFLKQHYTLKEVVTDSEAEMLQRAAELQASGVDLFVSNMPAQQLQALSARLGDRALIFNAGSASDDLRSTTCLNNVLHTLPSRAMLTDSLGQWLIAKRLNKWFLISGDKPQDKAFSAALKRSAKRFGGKIVEEKQWSFDTDLRRTAQKELPLFTQGKDYDVVLVADELGDFGEYVQYNTWLPRPVAGTQGLRPVAWHRVVEQWGAAQLQSRFDKLAGRWMTGRDYAAWAAVRSVAEAVTRTQSNDMASLRSYILSDKFELAAFKGRKLNYRPWNGQLRQPIPLVHPRALVSQSPQEGFLHPKTELDTLGFDAPESQCLL